MTGLRQVRGQQAGEQPPVAVQPGEHRVEPRAPLPVGGDGGHRAQGGRPVGGQPAEPGPPLPVGVVVEQHLGALQAGEVPRLGRRGGRQGVMRGGLRQGGVRRVPPPGEHQRGVHLVGEDASLTLRHQCADRPQFVGFHDPARRVVRVAQQQQVSAGGERGVQRVEVEDVPAACRPGHGDLEDVAAQQPRDDQERRVRGHRHDHRGAGAGEVLDGDVQRPDHVGQQPDVVTGHLPAVALPLPGGAGRARLGGQGGGEVAEHVPVDGGAQRGEDRRGGAVVGLGGTGTEAVRSGRLPLQPAGAAEGGGLDVGHGAGRVPDAHSVRTCCPAAMLASQFRPSNSTNSMCSAASRSRQRALTLKYPVGCERGR